MVQKDKELAPVPQDDGYSPLQKTIQAFIKADIMHRRAIEQWATDAGMHRSQHRMLMYLTRCKGTPSQKDLAKHFDISPAAVAVTLKKLENDGYIERGKCSLSQDSEKAGKRRIYSARKMRRMLRFSNKRDQNNRARKSSGYAKPKILPARRQRGV